MIFVSESGAKHHCEADQVITQGTFEKARFAAIFNYSRGWYNIRLYADCKL